MSTSNKVSLVKSEPPRFIGREALNTFPGTIFKVTHESDTAANNNIVMRTNSQKHPFLTLSNGALWHENVENYTFGLLGAKQILIEI